MSQEIRPFEIDLLAMTRELLDDAGLSYFQVGYMDRISDFVAITVIDIPAGVAPGFPRNSIVLCRPYVADTAPDILERAMVHEVAHAIVGYEHQHDEVWANVSRLMGGIDTPHIPGLDAKRPTLPAYYFGNPLMWNVTFPPEVN